MRVPYVWIALAVAALGSAANAAELIPMTRSRDVVVQSQSVSPPISRLADQDLGYSVLDHTGDFRGYRVHLTCFENGSFVQTYCSTKQYFASCPRAKIACR